MEQLTITDTIEVADLSVPIAANYEADGSLFGKRKATTAANTIAIVADALRWQYEAFPDIPEVQAVGSITIDSNTSGWTSIEIFINDPYLGNISFGKYYQNVPGEPPSTVAAGLAINSNTIAVTYGYYVESLISSPTVVSIYPPIGYGAAINGNNRISVQII